MSNRIMTLMFALIQGQKNAKLSKKKTTEVIKKKLRKKKSLGSHRILDPLVMWKTGLNFDLSCSDIPRRCEWVIKLVNPRTPQYVINCGFY